MSGMNDQMQHVESALLHTYNRFPVVLDHGEGVYLYDTEGKRYLDFAAGIAVCALGYHYPATTKRSRRKSISCSTPLIYITIRRPRWPGSGCSLFASCQAAASSLPTAAPRPLRARSSRQKIRLY